MLEVYELARRGPDREEGIRQLICNLQAQNRQLAADRDRYAAWMIEERERLEKLQRQMRDMGIAVVKLWHTYLPDWTFERAIAEHEGLAPAWHLIAENMLAAGWRLDGGDGL